MHYSETITIQLLVNRQQLFRPLRNVDFPLDNRKLLLGNTLSLDNTSSIEIANSQDNLIRDEKFNFERCIEMLNCATFAFHVFIL
jgi:hypothetical protein